MPILNVDKLAEIGIITDQLPMQLPPNAWTDGRNVRFDDNKASKILGWEEYFDPGSNWDGGTGEQVYWAIPYNDGSQVIWVYCGLKDVRATIQSGDKEITNVGGDANATAALNWTGGVLSSFLILNNGVDLPQSWSGDYATPAKLIDLANFSSQADKCGAMRVYKNYLIALDVTKSAVRYKSLVKWSDSAALGALPGSWDATDATTDAGETDLSERTKDVGVGALIDCLPLRDTNIVYTDSQTWAMDFIGGTFVFNFRQIFKNNGLLSRRCVQEFEGKHFCVGNNDVYVHDGNTLTSVIDSKRRRDLFADIDVDYYGLTYVFANYERNEMWVCYVREGSTLPNKALIWNWRHGAWGEADLVNTPHITTGIVDTAVASDIWSGSSDTWDSVTDHWNIRFNARAQSPLLCSDKLYKGDSTNTQDGTNMASHLERVDLPIGLQDQFVRIKAVYPKISGSSAVNIYVGSHMAPGDSPSYQPPVQFTPGVDQKVDVRKTGTHMAIKFDSSGDQDWDLWGYEVEYEPVSRR